ncbi:hypothetical protein M413DRAFT_79592 [Hebeloma cylindrosporum]|uniref:Ndc10 domain-containing protein n=1 Tax=Hebeloma cylindrosporum TaxID=76867 RepID=A0A0C3BT23_HEBCY|nr:hypothetical protein M413DRAFT_79592 [Hebeloma cylindrosporum h7]
MSTNGEPFWWFLSCLLTLGNASLAKQCCAFLLMHQLIKTEEEFLCANLPNDADAYIISWIMNECDEIMLDGSDKAPEVVCSTYSHAQKMRASMTHVFGPDLRLGNERWHKSETTGNMTGNPSVSTVLASYMVSLRNRKAHAGHVPTSARAITPEIMKKLYDFNGKYIQATPVLEYHSNSKMKSVHDWGGPKTRLALHAIYTLAFICLLRSDEVLKIRYEDIKFVEEGTNILYMIVTLPFRKMHQGGQIQPFYLYPLDKDEAHLCPVRAMAEWIHASTVTSGYMFRKFTAQDRPSDLDDAHMVS